MNGVTTAVTSIAAAAFVGFALSMLFADAQRTPYDKFAAECRASSIETQYAEHAGQRAMVVRCVREAR